MERNALQTLAPGQESTPTKLWLKFSASQTWLQSNPLDTSGSKVFVLRVVPGTLYWLGYPFAEATIQGGSLGNRVGLWGRSIGGQGPSPGPQPLGAVTQGFLFGKLAPECGEPARAGAPGGVARSRAPLGSGQSWLPKDTTLRGSILLDLSCFLPSD